MITSEFLTGAVFVGGEEWTSALTDLIFNLVKLYSIFVKQSVYLFFLYLKLQYSKTMSNFEFRT